MTHAEQVTPAYLRLHDSARYTGLSPSMVRKLARQGRIPKVRVGAAVCYPVAALRAYMDSCTQREDMTAQVTHLVAIARDAVIPQPDGTSTTATTQQRVDALIELVRLIAQDV